MPGQEQEIPEQRAAREEDARERVDLIARMRVHPDQVGQAEAMVRVAMFNSGIGGDELDRGGLVFETPEPLKPGQVRLEISAILSQVDALRILEGIQEEIRLLGVSNPVGGERIIGSLISKGPDGREAHKKVDITPR